jgi:hypothetical protein
LADTPTLALASLSERHRGITPEIGAAYAQAAGVCLSRHYQPPVAVRVTADAREDVQYRTEWSLLTQHELDAWGNRDDATRDGAYCMALAGIEQHLGLVAIGRAPVGSGADYYVGPPGSEVNPLDGLLDLENAFRLEVSGIDSADGEARILARVREKVEQARSGKSNLPAIAGVVAFNLLRIVFRNVQ